MNFVIGSYVYLTVGFADLGSMGKTFMFFDHRIIVSTKKIAQDDEEGIKALCDWVMFMLISPFKW